MSTQVIDLSKAFPPIPPVHLRDGRAVTVKPFSGLDLELQRQVNEHPDDTAAWYALAQRALPELTEAEVMALSEPEAVIVTTLAAEKYDLVATLVAHQGKARAAITGDSVDGD